MKSYLLLLSAALPVVIHAQVTDLSRDPNHNFNNKYSLPAADSREIKGTPFLLPYWAPATVQLAAGGAPISTSLKYDVYQ